MAMQLTSALCRAARGLLDWTQEELADRAGVSRSTVRSFERGQHALHRASASLIAGALTAAGVVLVAPANGLGAGVRLRSGLGDPAGWAELDEAGVDDQAVAARPPAAEADPRDAPDSAANAAWQDAGLSDAAAGAPYVHPARRADDSGRLRPAVPAPAKPRG